MELDTLAHFLFVPEAGKNSGSIHELLPSETFAENSFVLLPYQNPSIKAVAPQFYKVAQTVFVDAPDLAPVPQEPLLLRASTAKAEYIKNVTQLKAEIQRGNIYEINYCIRFFAEDVTIDPLQVFLKLNALAKAPYTSLLKTGNDFILCASPELFLKRENNSISTKPIKGTSRRGRTQEEDALLKKELYESLKERTENVMAVDVARNDLSQFAEKGSVKVNRLYNIETFETVHQMVSTVSCEIKQKFLDEAPAALFKRITDATFPMASMTGAPKLRAMQLIDACEDFERGPYSGAMGLIDEKMDFTLAVIIRSIFYNRQTKYLSLAVGGAITYLSDPEKEYEECLLKAQGLMKALNAYT